MFTATCKRFWGLGWTFVGLGLAQACDVPSPNASKAIHKPSKTQLQACSTLAERIVACSDKQLSKSPNDAIRCGQMLADGSEECNEAFDNFSACATGVACERMMQGACRLDYGATSYLCGGFLAADAARVIGISPLSH